MGGDTQSLFFESQMHVVWLVWGSGCERLAHHSCPSAAARFLGSLFLLVMKRHIH